MFMEVSIYVSHISIHALLAESDQRRLLRKTHQQISIHALLAESDQTKAFKVSTLRDFYPRSPCGERRYRSGVPVVGRSISIHALLAESDTSSTVTVILRKNFYPRSPCGERPINGLRHR